MGRTSGIFIFLGVFIVVAGVIWKVDPGHVIEYIFGGNQSGHILFLLPSAQEQRAATTSAAASTTADEASNAQESSAEVPVGPSADWQAPSGDVSAQDSANGMPGADTQNSGQPDQGSDIVGIPASGPLSAWINVTPSLVGSGSSATLSWDSQNASYCVVTGTNGDRWVARSSSSTPTSALRSPVTYTLQCKGGGTPPQTVEKIVRVTVAPSYNSQ